MALVGSHRLLNGGNSTHETTAKSMPSEGHDLAHDVVFAFHERLGGTRGLLRPFRPLDYGVCPHRALPGHIQDELLTVPSEPDGSQAARQAQTMDRWRESPRPCDCVWCLRLRAVVDPARLRRGNHKP